MEGAAAVLADVRWQAGALVALELARSAGLPGVLDLDRTLPDERDTVLRLIRAASHVFASEPGLRDLVGDGTIGAGLTGLAAIAARAEDDGVGTDRTVVGVTLGAAGVQWRVAGDDVDAPVLHHAAPQVTAVETLGAGDVWHGACAAALAAGAVTEVAIASASATAALRCTRRGGWEILPDAAEVAGLMDRQGSDPSTVTIDGS